MRNDPAPPSLDGAPTGGAPGRMAHRKEGGFDLQIKLLTIGNSGVGKTCLLLRYANDAFSPTFITTIGK